MRARLVAEAVGTFILVFCGAGAIVIDNVTGGGVSHVGVGLTFGLVVLAVIYAIGDVSGAHINPAVTVGFCVAGRCPDYEVLPYLASQAVGAFLASGVLWLMFPSEATVSDIRPPMEVKAAEPLAVERSETVHGFGATRPWGQRQPTYQQATQAFWLEVVLTFILMLVVLSVSHGPKEKGITAGIVVGSVIALEAIFAGPISGASMNPIRSLAPAAFAGELTQGWMWLCYVVAPVAGALLAVPVFQIIHQPKPRPAEGSAA
jgi:aquaporin NIP